MKHYALPLLLALTLAGCSEEPSATVAAAVDSNRPDNRELKVGLTQEFENLNAIIGQMMATIYLHKISGRTLVYMDTDANWQPQIVERIPSFDNGDAQIVMEQGRQKIRAQWRIKDDQFWGDGTPVTATDIEFSWRVGSHKNVTVGEKEVYTTVERVELDPADDKAFVFIYEKARWDFARMGSFFTLPEHLEGPVFERHADQPLGYEKNTLYVTAPTTAGLYNGPYRVSEIKLGSHLVFKRNEHWRGQPPAIEQLVFKIIPNTATLEANIRSGTIDMISVLGLKFDQAMKFEKTVLREQLPLQVNYKPSITYEHIDLQLNNPLLQDVRVRRALVHAINREELVNALFEGKQARAIHNIAPIDPWYSDDPTYVVDYPYSPRRANKLLDEAGWTLGPDNYRSRDGVRLSLQFMTTAGDKSRELVQTYLQDQWKAVGIEITIKNEPARVYFGETVRKGKYSALAMFAYISSPENSPKSTLHSKNIPRQDNQFSGQNTGGWVSEPVDRLLELLDGEFDETKRLALVQQILQHYTDQVPVIPLYYRSDISVTPNNLEGYQLPGHQFQASNNVEYWNLTE